MKKSSQKSNGKSRQWRLEIRDAHRNIRALDPNLARLELEQVRKKSLCPKYNRKSLGQLATINPEGFKRFMMCQMNSISTRLTREAKLEQSRQLINHYDVDMKFALELGINWWELPRSESFASFYEVEIDLGLVVSHVISTSGLLRSTSKVVRPF